MPVHLKSPPLAFFFSLVSSSRQRSHHDHPWGGSNDADNPSLGGGSNPNLSQKFSKKFDQTKEVTATGVQKTKAVAAFGLKKTKMNIILFMLDIQMVLVFLHLSEQLFIISTSEEVLGDGSSIGVHKVWPTILGAFPCCLEEIQ
ncbi:uncharacterized protein [Henckelia pumila]|uniref:uncharacterized protein n=1 Tax=Henckelia pumila TaxID=405737 RepID=UPI003C6E8F0A